MLHKFSVGRIKDSITGAKVEIDGNCVICSGYELRHYVDEVPTLELHMPIIPLVEHDVIVQISNKEEIARLMDDKEFSEFCDIWREVHE